MRVLLTRPLEDAVPFAQMLAARGHDAVIAPLLEIRFADGAEISLDDVQAILATSANGVRATARRTARRDVPVFAVGPQTAEEARRAGFATVRNAEGDGAALARATVQWASPQNGALLHAAGGEAPKFLAGELEKSGFTIRREILYQAVAANALPDAALSALKNDTLDAVMHFSPRSARLFCELTAEAGLVQDCKKIRALCISKATADAAAAIAFGQICIAQTPSQTAMLALLE
jgi:uroporphyrinogen-III synthase